MIDRRSLRRFIKSILTSIPLNIGSRFLIPLCKYVYFRLPFYEWRRKRLAQFEAKRILTNLKTGTTRIVVVYDLVAAPLIYGEFFVALMLVRYFQRSGINASILVIYSNTAPILGVPPVKVTEDETVQMLNSWREIANTLLSQAEEGVIFSTSYDELDRFENSPHVYIVESDLIRKRTTNGPTFNYFNIFNQLMSGSDNTIIDQVFLTDQDFADVLPEVPDIAPFITWHCRYQNKWSTSRNLSNSEFTGIYELLRTNFPNHHLLVISDSIGCHHYKEVSELHQMRNIVFSEDFSTSFLSDVSLIFQSDLFVSLRGGGMCIVAKTSSQPYFIVCELAKEVMWDRRRLTSWQRDDQYYIEDKRFSTFVNYFKKTKFVNQTSFISDKS